MLTNLFGEDPPVSNACERDDHYECDGSVYDRKTGKEIAKCTCYCHKPTPEPEQDLV